MSILNQSAQLISQTNQYGANNYQPLSVVISEAEGVWVKDLEGNRYLDMLSAYSAVNQGHRHPKIIGALKKQADKVTLTSRAFHNDQLGPWYEKICKLTNKDMALPMNTGAEAVETAVKDHPDALVIFKPHPDDLGGYTKNRPKKSTLEDIGKIASVLTAPMTVPDCFPCVDHVYTITSLAGFEALLRGKTVTVLGYPFYAGWGLTDDRQSDSRRTRKLSLLELFAAAYLLYPAYFDPESCEKSTAKDTILAISRERSAQQSRS